MAVHDLTYFLNNANLQGLDSSLDELDLKIREIFLRTKSELDDALVKEIESGDAEFLVWFGFLHSNFLRGKNTISNRAFKQFIDFCERERNDYYFKKFPVAEDLLPRFKEPKFQYAKAVEEVLDQVRKKYSSGREFVKEIRCIVESHRPEEVHRVYLKLVSVFMSYRQVNFKIANAIVGEVAYQLGLLKKYGKEKEFEMLTSEEWIRNLSLASCFNVMIDTHVRSFFENQGMKSVDHVTLLLVARDVSPEVIELLFKRNYPWFNKKSGDFLLENYHDYIGANVVEKLIWEAYFVKANSSKDENLDNLRFYRLSKVFNN